MVYLHSGILYHNENEPTIAIYDNMEGSHNDVVEWKKSSAKEYTWMITCKSNLWC